jgi:hypothetical protein
MTARPPDTESTPDDLCAIELAQTLLPAHPSLRLLAADDLQLPRAELAGEFKRTTGQALRRTGPLTALAVLACLRSVRKEAPGELTPPASRATVLLWHTRSVFGQDAQRLMRIVLHEREPLMPLDFLASQPALVGIGVHAFLPELTQAICLPWVEDAGITIWPRVLQLASLWLADARSHDQPGQEAHCQRVICLEMMHDVHQCRTRALSLGLGSEDF